MSNSLQQIPALASKVQGPLKDLERKILDQQAKIECWLREQWRKTPPPIYASVDLRNSGFKIAPVDTNLFPAGFNNLNSSCLPLAIQAAQAVFEQIMPGCLRILIIPENHTRNPFYFESVATLQDILLKAGFEVRIGSLIKDLQQPKEVTLPSGRSFLLEPLHRSENRIELADFSPLFIIVK